MKFPRFPIRKTSPKTGLIVVSGLLAAARSRACCFPGFISGKPYEISQVSNKKDQSEDWSFLLELVT